MTISAFVSVGRRMAAPLAAAAMLTLAGCAATHGPAPVEERAAAGVAAAASAPAPKPPEVQYGPDGRALTYVVKPGDTLMRIALDAGQSWRDLARWNKLDNPNLIEVNQVLRILPPEGEAVTTPVAARPPVAVKPAEPKAAASAPLPAASASPVPAPAPAPQPAAAVAGEDVQWAWPAAGAVTTPFDESRNKGLAIAGKVGEPVYAAADGRVIYANSGLRGYGNLIIVKHNSNLLSVYAHNQTLLVKEDQTVKRGQKIAEMGSSDADRVQLHFEVRRQGKPINPASVLPPR